MLKRPVPTLYLITFFATIVVSYSKTPPEQYNEHTNNNEHRSPLAVKYQPAGNKTPAQSNEPNAEERLANWILDFRLTDLLIIVFTGVLAWKTSGLYTETAALR